MKTLQDGTISLKTSYFFCRPTLTYCILISVCRHVTAMWPVSVTLSSRQQPPCNITTWEADLPFSYEAPGRSFHPKKGRQTWRPRRWTALIQRHWPPGESTGYLCRYYGRQNEAHPFPAAWTMTSGIWGPWWRLAVVFPVTQNSHRRSKKECLDSPHLVSGDQRVPISSWGFVWQWQIMVENAISSEEDGTAVWAK